MHDTHPNLLFIMTDHQRADILGMVQDGIEVTPNLNRLAAQGTTFERAYTTCPLCVPARTALATGLYPTKNGVVFNDWRGMRAEDHTPVHQFLFEAGYDVAHIGVHHIRVRPTLQDRVPFSPWISNEDHSRFLADQGIGEPPEGLGRFKKEVTDQQDGSPVQARYSNTQTAVWPHPEAYFKDTYFCQQAAERAVFAQYSGNAALGHLRRAVITRQHKYVYDLEDQPELYDLHTDPLEMHNLASTPEGRAVVRRLHEEARAWAERHEDWVDF